MNLDKIKERIRRALALAGDPCNANESAQAAALAARLMSQYRIDEDSLLQVSDVKSTEVSWHCVLEGKERVQKWVWPILRQLSSMHQCFPLTSAGKWYVIGDEKGASAIRYMLDLICSQVDNLADREWNKYNCTICTISENEDIISFSNESSKSWKHSFRLGCAVEIGKRLYSLHRETIKKLESGGVTESGGSYSNALAVINKKESLVEEIVERHRKSGLFGKSAPTVSKSSEAYMLGKKSAHEVNIGNKAKGALK